MLMNRADEMTLQELVEAARSGAVDRRGFLTGAAKAGLSVSLASGIFGAVEAGAGAAGRAAGPIRSVSFQDGGKTVIVAIAQATVQLDPAFAGGNGYGDIIPTNENLY